MPTLSKFATAPRPWAAVLLGHGSFLHGDDDPTPHYIIPDAAVFLEMRPSIERLAPWPLETTATGKKMGKFDTMVFLAVCVGHACYDDRIVTEFGFTVFDSRDQWVGGKFGSKGATEGCMPLGDRGKNLMRQYKSSHFILADTASHHDGTCSDARHREKPYEFCFRKSNMLLRRELRQGLERAFDIASRKGLDQDAIKRGARRPVVLVSWGQELPDAVCETTWFAKTAFAEHWDVSQHDVLGKVFPNGITFEDALRVFGVPHRVNGFDIAQNSGNRSSFTMQLLWAITLVTGSQLTIIKNADESGNHGQLEPWGLPGVQSVLIRDNRPPGTMEPAAERIDYTQPSPPKHDLYTQIRFEELSYDAPPRTTAQASKPTAATKSTGPLKPMLRTAKKDREQEHCDCISCGKIRMAV